MKKAILENKIAGTGKVFIFKSPHTQSKVLDVADNGTKCEILKGPMPTDDRYPGIYLYKIKTAHGITGYVNRKYVK